MNRNLAQMPSPSMLRRRLAWLDVDGEWGFSDYADMVLLYWSLATRSLDKRYVRLCLQRNVSSIVTLHYSRHCRGLKGSRRRFSWELICV